MPTIPKQAVGQRTAQGASSFLQHRLPGFTIQFEARLPQLRMKPRLHTVSDSPLSCRATFSRNASFAFPVVAIMRTFGATKPE